MTTCIYQFGTSKDVIIHQGATFNLKSDIVGGDKLEIQNTNIKELTVSKIEGVDNSGIKDLSKCLPNYRLTGEKIGRVCVIAKSEEGHTRNIWVNVVDSETSKAPAKVVNGDGYTVTLRSDGSIWAFGNITGKNSPSKIEMQEEVIDISSGSGHVLLLGKSGKVYSFGANASGQLGIGNVDVRSTPKEITLGLTTDITKIVACGNTSFAIDIQGMVYAFGEGYTKVPTIIKNDKNVIDISKNYYLSEDGVVRKLADNTEIIIASNERAVQMSEGKDHLLLLGESRKSIWLRSKYKWTARRRN